MNIKMFHTKIIFWLTSPVRNGQVCITSVRCTIHSCMTEEKKKTTPGFGSVISTEIHQIAFVLIYIFILRLHRVKGTFSAFHMHVANNENKTKPNARSAPYQANVNKKKKNHCTLLSNVTCKQSRK